MNPKAAKARRVQSPKIIGLGELKPDEKNARLHTPRNIGMIVNSLQEVGAARSIVIDENGLVLAGNGVVEAAGQIGMEDVRIIDSDGRQIIAIRRRGLTDAQKKHAALYDNRTSELADWSAERLKELFDDNLLTGLWSDNELEDVLSEVGLSVNQFPEEEGVTGIRANNKDAESLELLFANASERKTVAAWLKQLRDKYGLVSSGEALFQFLKENNFIVEETENQEA